MDAGGAPYFEPRRGECTFCGGCADACDSGAIARSPAAPPWSWVARVGASCLGHQGVVCMTCQDACPEQAITHRPVQGGAGMPRVDADRCSGCGACVAPCPTGALALVLPTGEPCHA